MSTIPFDQTKQGVIFYSGTMPRIAKALERIADALEAQNKITTEQIKESKKLSYKEKIKKETDINE